MVLGPGRDYMVLGPGRDYMVLGPGREGLHGVGSREGGTTWCWVQ